MRFVNPVIFVVVTATTAACTLLVDTDDLHRPGPGVDAAVVADANPTKPETGVEASTPIESGAPDAYFTEVMSDTPSSFWRLAEAAGAASAQDETRKRSGKYSGVTLGLEGPAPGHASAGFDGLQSYVQIPTIDKFSGLSVFTVEAWVRPDKDGTSSCRHIFTQETRVTPKRGIALLNYADSNSNQGIILERFIGDGDLRNSRGDDPWLLPVEVFTHVVGVFDGKNVVYVNGVLVQKGPEDTRSMPPYDIDSFIGASGREDPGCWWKGRIAEVAVYEKALTPERISAHFKAMPK